MIQLFFAVAPFLNQDPLDIREMTQISTSIIIGEVLTQRVEVNNGQVSTYVTIMVEETLKGTPVDVFDVKIHGAKLNDVELNVKGIPRFIDETKVLLYLSNQSIVGQDDGAFIIENNRAWRNINDKTFVLPHILFPTFDVLESSYYFESYPIEDVKWIVSTYKNK